MDPCTVIIAEPNIDARETLIHYSNQLRLDVVDVVKTGKRLVEAYTEHQADLLIVNFALRKYNAWEACNHILKKGFAPKMIFIAHSPEKSHYQMAFELEAVDLVKEPVALTPFVKAVNKARNLLHTSINGLHTNSDGLKTPGRIICYRHRYREKYVREDQIVYVMKASKRLAHIVCSDGTILETCTTLRDIEDQCSESFTRSHKSYLVNSHYIGSIHPDLLSPDCYTIHLDIGEEIPFSRKYYDQFKTAIKQH